MVYQLWSIEQGQEYLWEFQWSLQEFLALASTVNSTHRPPPHLLPPEVLNPSTGHKYHSQKWVGHLAIICWLRTNVTNHFGRLLLPETVASLGNINLTQATDQGKGQEGPRSVFEGKSPLMPRVPSLGSLNQRHPPELASAELCAASSVLPPHPIGPDSTLLGSSGFSARFPPKCCHVARSCDMSCTSTFARNLCLLKHFQNINTNSSQVLETSTKELKNRCVQLLKRALCQCSTMYRDRFIGQKHRFSDKTGKKWLTNRFPKIISQDIDPIKPS